MALYINLHGPRFIIVEFGVGTPAIITVGLLLMLDSSAFLFGFYILLTGIDYLPLLAYALVLVRSHTAEKEVSYGLSQDKHYNRKYSVQQLMIFLPTVILLVAIMQELKKHN